jgi:hypothetical protein
MILIPIIITTVGFILALAVHPTHPGSVNVNTVGWILVVVGIFAFIADMLFWSSRGPGYLRRTTVVDDPGGYPVRRMYGQRRQVVEEEQVGPPPPGPGY